MGFYDCDYCDEGHPGHPHEASTVPHETVPYAMMLNGVLCHSLCQECNIAMEQLEQYCAEAKRT